METPPLQRTLAYRDLIATNLTDDLFHARSFQCAPLATARLLLSWRDDLIEAGWHGGHDHGDAPARLQVLAGLEFSFRNTGLAEATHAGRIAAILSELESGSQPAIGSLTVIDPPGTLPRCWIKLFAALDASYDNPAPTTGLAEPFIDPRLGPSQSRRPEYRMPRRSELRPDRHRIHARSCR